MTQTASSGQYVKWREALTAPFVDVTLPRVQGPLAVVQGPIIAMYRLDHIEATTAIYAI